MTEQEQRAALREAAYERQYGEAPIEAALEVISSADASGYAAYMAAKEAGLDDEACAAAAAKAYVKVVKG